MVQGETRGSCSSAIPHLGNRHPALPTGANRCRVGNSDGPRCRKGTCRHCYLFGRRAHGPLSCSSLRSLMRRRALSNYVRISVGLVATLVVGRTAAITRSTFEKRIQKLRKLPIGFG